MSAAQFLLTTFVFIVITVVCLQVRTHIYAPGDEPYEDLGFMLTPDWSNATEVNTAFGVLYCVTLMVFSLILAQGLTVMRRAMFILSIGQLIQLVQCIVTVFPDPNPSMSAEEKRWSFFMAPIFYIVGLMTAQFYTRNIAFLVCAYVLTFIGMFLLIATHLLYTVDIESAAFSGIFPFLVYHWYIRSAVSISKRRLLSWYENDALQGWGKSRRPQRKKSGHTSLGVSRASGPPTPVQQSTPLEQESPMGDEREMRTVTPPLSLLSPGGVGAGAAALPSTPLGDAGSTDGNDRFGSTIFKSPLGLGGEDKVQGNGQDSNRTEGGRDTPDSTDSVPSVVNGIVSTTGTGNPNPPDGGDPRRTPPIGSTGSELDVAPSQTPEPRLPSSNALAGADSDIPSPVRTEEDEEDDDADNFCRLEFHEPEYGQVHWASVLGVGRGWFQSPVELQHFRAPTFTGTEEDHLEDELIYRAKQIPAKKRTVIVGVAFACSVLFWMVSGMIAAGVLHWVDLSRPLGSHLPFDIIHAITPPIPDHTPDFFLYTEVLAVLLWTLYSKQRLVILRRTIFMLGALWLLRSMTLPATYLPDPSNICVKRTHQSGTTCGDLIFSGHAISFLLVAFIVRFYIRHKLLEVVVWIYTAVSLVVVVVSRLHYTRDVVTALVVVFSFIHLCHVSVFWRSDRKLKYPLLFFFELDQSVHQLQQRAEEERGGGRGRGGETLPPRRSFNSMFPTYPSPYSSSEAASSPQRPPSEAPLQASSPSST